jgi:hypothetical protein
MAYCALANRRLMEFLGSELHPLASTLSEADYGES